MENTTKVSENLELFSDVFSESCNYLYEITKKDYFQLILLTAENILAGKVLNDFDDETIKKLEEIYKPLEDVSFNVEDVRKTFQAQVLRAFKELNLDNGYATPDTLGILCAYLISRLKPKQKNYSICDPLMGTGNLIYTISNHLDANLNLFGCDHDVRFVKLAKVQADLLETPIEIFFEDTFNLNLSNMDFVVFDSPNIFDDSDYFPYKAVMKYLSFLKDDGYMIGVLPIDFFEHDPDKKFKNEFSKIASVMGIIELPDDFFKSNKKVIVVFEKKIRKEKNCFMVKLPSFSDVNLFNEELIKLESWFNENIKD